MKSIKGIVTHARCNLCVPSKEVGYHNSTTNLKKHLSSHLNMKEVQTFFFPEKGSTANIKDLLLKKEATPFNSNKQSEISKLIGLMIARDLQPMSIVEDVGFR